MRDEGGDRGRGGIWNKGKERKGNEGKKEGMKEEKKINMDGGIEGRKEGRKEV